MEEQGVGAGGGTDTGMPQLPKGWVLGLVNLQHSEWLGREREKQRERERERVSPEQSQGMSSSIVTTLLLQAA